MLFPGVVQGTKQNNGNGCGTSTRSEKLDYISFSLYKLNTYARITSRKSHIPRRDAATPRTADEIICVIGEVTLIESRLARLIKKPRVPYQMSVASDQTKQLAYSYGGTPEKRTQSSH